MQRVCLFVNSEKPGAGALAEAVRTTLAGCGIAALPQAELPRCEALVAIGGDGTILRGARLALPFGIPVLGVNAGRLGFLAGLERDELHLLPLLAEPVGGDMLDARMLLEVRLWEGERQLECLCCINDAAIARHSSSRVAELTVDCGGNNFPYRGDGVIFSTPTGSTAYSLSAGGPVLDPQLESILLTPICNHLLFARSILFSPGAAFEIHIPEDGLALTCDAEPPVILRAGQRVTVRRAEEQIRFIRLKTRHFLEILSKKLVAGGREG
ncbi:MAG: NAD(+)/NADH kinase [Oscillospiraceae bacterium]|nr:NAD(+)/NADH kinase [Oscillospiraceae bacterium]